MASGREGFALRVTSKSSYSRRSDTLHVLNGVTCKTLAMIGHDEAGSNFAAEHTAPLTPSQCSIKIQVYTPHTFTSRAV